MKAQIMTYLSNNNYGAFLQCYATLKLFQREGWDAELVDIRVEDLYKQKIKSVKDVLRAVRDCLFARATANKEAKFEAEISKLNKTERMYSPAAVRARRYDADLYVTGSDQTLNLRLRTFDPILLWDFVHGVKKIAFASSGGEYLKRFSDSDIADLGAYLADYSAVSTREPAIGQVLEKLGISSQVLTDPTLMITGDEWRSFADYSACPDGDYIAFYTVLTNADIVANVRALSKRYGLPVVALHPITQFEVFSGFRRSVDSGPRQFVGILDRAKFVCTASYHGACFAANLGKPFYAYKVGEGNRLSGLMASLGTEARLKGEGNYPDSCDFDFDSTDSLQHLAKLRAQAQEYLRGTLRDV